MTDASEFRGILSRVKGNIRSHMDAGLSSPFMPGLFQGPGPGKGIKAASLEDLEGLTKGCARCRRHEGRTNIVFGEGDPVARLLFIGEGPAKEDDLAARPFMGEAGSLLTRIIEGGLGLKREDVYICNLVKCRPHEDRTPEQDEIEACIPFLKEQIRIIRPEVICTLGHAAAREIIGQGFRITEERGRWQAFMDIPVMPTYHPAYIVRNPGREKELKGQVWEDIKKIIAKLTKR